MHRLASSPVQFSVYAWYPASLLPVKVSPAHGALRTGSEPIQCSFPALSIWDKCSLEGSPPKGRQSPAAPYLAMMLLYLAISNSFLLVGGAGARPSSEFSLCSIS